MLKLGRNALGTLRRLKDADGGIIDYRYIEDLVNFQEDIGMRLGTKVNKDLLLKFESDLFPDLVNVL